MALPIINQKKYSTFLVNENKEIEYRGYTAGEEKILLSLYSDNKDKVSAKDIFVGLKDILTNCTFDKIDIAKLSIHDITWLFLKIREVSAGDDVNLKLPCKKCGHKNKVEYNISDIAQPKQVKNHNKIILDESRNLGIVLKNPSFEDYIEVISNEEQMIEPTELLLKTIDYVYEGDSVFFMKEETKEEQIKFVNSLNIEHGKKISEFFENTPRPSIDILFKCGECSHDNKYTVEGLFNFFS